MRGHSQPRQGASGEGLALRAHALREIRLPIRPLLCVVAPVVQAKRRSSVPALHPWMWSWVPSSTTTRPACRARARNVGLAGLWSAASPTRCWDQGCPPAVRLVGTERQKEVHRPGTPLPAYDARLMNSATGKYCQKMEGGDSTATGYVSAGGLGFSGKVISSHAKVADSAVFAVPHASQRNSPGRSTNPLKSSREGNGAAPASVES